MPWYAATTKPRQENKAEANLLQQGYNAYLPRIARKKHRGGRWQQVIEPLFPGYLFIQADPDEDDLAPVRSTLGMRQMVRFGTRLAVVPDEIVAFLKDHDAALKPTPKAAQNSPFKPGESVDILEGPFKGLNGLYQVEVAAERVLVLVELLGRCNKIEINVDDIVPSQ